MEEIWKDVEGYKGLYQISNLGRVKSLKDNIGNHRILIKKLSLNKNGYFFVRLWKNGIAKNCYIHRLTMVGFNSNVENKRTINHKDGNKQNNNIDNLEWNTYSENENHAYKLGLKSGLLGKLNPSAKLNQDEVDLIRKLRNEYKIKLKTLSSLFDISIATISLISRNKLWSCK